MSSWEARCMRGRVRRGRDWRPPSRLEPHLLHEREITRVGADVVEPRQSRTQGRFESRRSYALPSQINVLSRSPRARYVAAMDTWICWPASDFRIKSASPVLASPVFPARARAAAKIPRQGPHRKATPSRSATPPRRTCLPKSDTGEQSMKKDVRAIHAQDPDKTASASSVIPAIDVFVRHHDP